VLDPERSPRLDAYADEYHRLRSRRGVMRAAARRRLAEPDRFAAMAVACGDADLMIAGTSAHYADTLRAVLEIVGPAPGVRRISSHHLVLLPRDVVFLADCAVNVEPDAEALAEIALLTAAAARSLGFDPQVAMLSFSNFGSTPHPLSEKVRRAVELVREKAPDLAVDGEMQADTAVVAEIVDQRYPFSRVKDANVLVFPSLEAANIAYKLVDRMSDAQAIGPILLGMGAPVHVLQTGDEVRDIVNMAAIAAVDAAGRGKAASAKAGARNGKGSPKEAAPPKRKTGKTKA
jgi:malate dehydrogenase (oxaloacetate-decarboxylating)(NADP+)